MDKWKKILQFLIENEKMVSAAEIAHYLHISVKTVRNELQRLETYVSEYQCSIVKIPGKGIRLDGEKSNIRKLEKALDRREKNWENTPEERQYRIWNLLLGSSKCVMMKEICAEYYVSKATVNNDMKELNQLLSQYGVSIVYEKQQGLRLEGKEQDIRSAMIHIFLNVHMGNLNDIIRLDGTKILYNEKIRNMEEMWNVDFSSLVHIVHEIEEKFQYKFSSESVLELAMYLAVMLRRADCGCNVSVSRETAGFLYGSVQMEVCDQVADKLEERYGISLPTQERKYFLVQILGARRLQQPDSLMKETDIGDNDIKEAVEIFIEAVGRELGVDFCNNRLLYEQLRNHIRPSVYRILFGLNLNNPLSVRIKEEYRKVFSVVYEKTDILNEAFHVVFPEEEIAYVTIHFVIALEKLTPKIRVLLVCTTGLGLSQLMVSKLEGQFKNIEIVAAISAYDIEHYRNEDIDMILSTIEIEELDWVKTIVVNPIFSRKDIENITQEICFRSTKGKIAYLFQKQNIYFLTSLMDKKAAIGFLAAALVRHGLVTEEFEAGMERRERLGSTYIGNGTAVVHGEMEQVLSSTLQIMRLENPIEWGDGNRVNLIINVVSTKEDSISYSKIFRALGNYLDNEDFWKRLKACETPEKMAELLNKELAYDY
jgi:activator of the mannose operon (transcriptional antiterminator)